MAKKSKKKKETPLKVFGDLDDVLKASVKGNPAPEEDTSSDSKKFQQGQTPTYSVEVTGPPENRGQKRKRIKEEKKKKKK